MPTVRIDALVPARDPGEVFDTVADFARYPELVDIVRSVEVGPPGPDGSFESRWAVLFRNGILRWSELDRCDRETLTIEFDQTEGDFDIFRGGWELSQQGDDVVVTFEAEFDFGVASLASIVDPVAKRVLKETMWTVLHGLFDTPEAEVRPAPVPVG